MSAKFAGKTSPEIRRNCNKWGRLFGTIPCEHYLINGREVRIRHRATRADREAIHQCLLQRQYEIPSVRGALEGSSDNFYEAVLSTNKKPLIIDAGANIGASVIWFATRYPGAQIVAVEPAPNNCDLLVFNTRYYDVEVR